MDLKCEISGDPMSVQLQREAQRVRRAATAALNEASANLKNRLRADVAPVLGTRVANSWRGISYGKDSNNPANLTYTKAPKIMAAFSDGVPITAKNGNWLAIPTENAPKTINGRKVRPDLMQGIGFHLEFVLIRPNLALLIAKNVLSSVSRKTGATRYRRNLFTKNRRTGRIGQKKGVDVVMFYLVKQTRPRKLFDLPTRANEAQADLNNILGKKLAG